MKRACVTGHRAMSAFPAGLRETLQSVVLDGYTEFLVGMALGFDQYCCEELLRMKGEFPQIRIVACIPCGDQAARFTRAQKARYDRLCAAADERIVLYPSYVEGCMQERNRYMVDNCSRLIALSSNVSGGTKYTLEYAAAKKIEIIYIDWKKS